METKVITGVVRFSYAHVFEPQSIEEGGEKKFSVSLIIPKKDKETLSVIEKVVDALKDEYRTKNGKLPLKFKTPLRDGDEEKEDDENYRGCMFLSASSKSKPGVVDKNCKQIIDPDEFYSGCYGHASINFYLFDKAGNKGIACGLNNLMKTKDGDPLSGRASAEDDFATLRGAAEEDDDLM